MRLRRFPGLVAAILSALLPASRAVAGGYGWTISSSDTDPFAHTGAAGALGETVYLWLACDAAVEGAASAEFGIVCSGTLNSLTPMNGVANSGTAAEPRLTIPGCHTGGPLLAASLSVSYLLFAGATLCIVPSSNGIDATTTCLGRVVPNGTIGYSSKSGTPPCNEGASLCVSSDVSVELSASGSTPFEAEPFTLRVVARNLGPLAVGGIEVSDLVESPLVFESAAAGQGGYNPSSGLWTVGSLAVGDSATLALTVHAAIGSGGGTAVNRATRTAGSPFDADVFNDADSVSVSIVPLPRADVAVSVDAPPDALCETDSVVISLVVGNSGPDAATAVEVTNALPGSLAPAGHVASQGTFDAGTGVWSVGNLASGNNATLELTAVVGTGGAGQALPVVASVTSLAEADTTNGNDADTTVVNVQAGATGTFRAVTGTPGNPVTMTLDVVDDTDVTGIVLRHRNGGEADFRETAMTRTSPNLWEATIDGADVGTTGLQCLALVTTPCVTARVPAAGFAGVRVPVSGTVFTLAAGRFALLGIPFEPSDGAILSVFDELAPYDTRRWRYGTWNGPSYGDGPGQARDPAPGRGFWIYSRDEAVIAASGWSTDLSGDFTIPLAPGWNQVANPFPFAVPFAAVARPAGVSDDLVRHDGGGYVHFAPTLEAGKAYWIRNTTASPIPLAIPCDPALPGAAPPAAAPGFAPAFAPGEWMISVTAASALGRDPANAVGVRADASDGSDAHDYPDAPLPPGEYLIASFEDEAGRLLQTDFRSPGGEGRTWTLAIRSSGPSVAYDLRVDLPVALPAAWSARIVDPSGAGIADIASGATVHGRTLAGPETARWTVLAGTPAFLARALSDRTAASATRGFPELSAAPNPARRDGLVLSVVLPAPAPARLSVYDVRGRLVRELHDGPLAAGLHRFRWAPGDPSGPIPAAGVYFVQLRTPGASTHRKVVLLDR